MHSDQEKKGRYEKMASDATDGHDISSNYDNSPVRGEGFSVKLNLRVIKNYFLGFFKPKDDIEFLIPGQESN